jgi:hypothetical protein
VKIVCVGDKGKDLTRTYIKRTPTLFLSAWREREKETKRGRKEERKKGRKTLTKNQSCNLSPL